MAINLASMMLNPSPVARLDFGSGGRSGMERERLRQAREEFAALQAYRKQQLEQGERAEKGEMARAKMLAEREKTEAAATVAAQLEKDRLAIEGKVLESAQKGDIEGGQILSGGLGALGSGLDVTERPGQLPLWRLHHDVAKDRAQEAAEANRNWETAERPIFEYPYQDEMEENPLPVIKPVTPTGSAIDLQALAEQRLARLKPGLTEFTEAYPEGMFRDSAGHTQEAIEGLAKAGMPAPELMTEYRQQRQGPNDAYKTLLENETQKDKFRETRDELTPMDEEAMKDRGINRGAESYKNMGIKEATASMEAADVIVELLTNDDHMDDGKVTNYLMAMTHNKGAQTEGDALRAVGEEQATSLEQGLGFFQKKIQGGFPDALRESILGFAEMIRDQDKTKTFTWLDNISKQIENPKTHERARAGYEEFRDNNLPQWLRDEYEETRAARRAEARPDETTPTFADPEAVEADYSTMSDFELELEGRFLEAGLDPDAMRQVIGPESGGSASVRNARSGATSIIQFLPGVAKALGTSVEELAKMTPAEQLPWTIKYLKGWGINEASTPDDYAMAVAAPAFIGKPDTAVVYPKGTKAWADNPAWRPSGGGDITVGDILKFYGRRGAGKSKGPAEPKPGSPVDAELLDIYEKP